MQPTYFEALHREEARRNEWRTLDQALQTRRCGTSWLRHWQSRVGHAMIGLGTRLVDQQDMCDNSAMQSCH
jgi:hypothetical protein